MIDIANLTLILALKNKAIHHLHSMYDISCQIKSVYLQQTFTTTKSSLSLNTGKVVVAVIQFSLIPVLSPNKGGGWIYLILLEKALTHHLHQA